MDERGYEVLMVEGGGGRVAGVERVGGLVRVKRIKKFWDFLLRGQREKKRTMVMYGGGRSGKSYSIRQYIVDQAIRHMGEGLEILVVMKTRASLKHAAWEPMLEMLDDWGIGYRKHETLYIITIGESHIVMAGLDDPEKVKSTEWSMIWCEEATRLDYEDYLQLRVRLSRPGPVPNQIFLSFNPVSINNWCMEKVVLRGDVDGDMLVMHSTYKDNAFIDEEYVKDLENLRDQNKNMWLIYARGEPALLNTIIYSNWDVIDWVQVPMGIRDRKMDPDDMGYDFGFTHPLSLCAYWEYEGEDYIMELVHEKGMQTEILIEKMDEMGLNKSVELWCPSEVPGVIELFCARGWNAKAVPSEYRGVKDGIDYCKGRKVHFIMPSENYIKGAMGYSYKEKKDGVVLEEPVKFEDDAMDAMRYARVSIRDRFQGFRVNKGGKLGRGGGDRITEAMEEGLVWREREREDEMFM